MCQCCMQSPCHPRCPNADEPEKVYVCEWCGEGIYPEENYLELGNDYYHLDCVEDNAVQMFIELFGARKGIA